MNDDYILGINDPQIWMTYFSALRYMVYGDFPGEAEMKRRQQKAMLKNL